MTTDDELRRAMQKAMEGFADVAATIEHHHWQLPTPCDGWSVLDVVDHVVAGERFTVGVLGGASLDDAVAAQVGIDLDRGDVVKQVTDASAPALAAFGGTLDRIIEHRVGQITARRMLGFRIIDELGHTWDIATAIGVPVALDDAALAIGVEIAMAERPTLERSPNFAIQPEDEIESADPLETFLRALGRSPTR